MEQPIFRDKFQIQATLTFQKPILFYHLKEKNRRSFTKLIVIAAFSFLINLRPNYFSIYSKLYYFSNKEYIITFQSHSTTNHFFTFRSCPIGITFTYSVRIFCGVMFPANQKLVCVTSKCLNVQKSS